MHLTFTTSTQFRNVRLYAAQNDLLQVHHAARRDAILAVMDIDMRPTMAYFAKLPLFVSTGVSMYFPIVVSEYDPKMIERAEVFYNKPVAKLGREYRGAWDVFGYVNLRSFFRMFLVVSSTLTACGHPSLLHARVCIIQTPHPHGNYNIDTIRTR